MNFNLYLHSFGLNNTDKAKRREARKAIAITLGLEALGHRVKLSSRAAVPTGLEHLLPEGKYRDAIEIHSNVLTVPDGSVILKSSMTQAYDKHLSVVSSAFVAVDCHKDSVHPIMVPFGVSDHMMELFRENGLFVSYACGDVERIRKQFCQREREGGGFIGYNGYGRREKIEAAKSWLSGDYRLTDAVPVVEYAKTLGSWQWGLALAGDHPQSYRFCELVLFGCLAVCDARWNLTPAVDDSNSSLLADGKLPDNIDERIEKATRDYIEGWSPVGIARQIVRKIESANRH